MKPVQCLPYPSLTQVGVLTSYRKDERLLQMFRILHLSDLHARVADTWSTNAILHGARKAILEVCETDPIDVVAFSGDVAFSGAEQEYELAAKWIEDSCLASSGLNLQPDRLLFVPGNHDVDRSEIGVIGASLQTTLRHASHQGDIASVFDDRESLTSLLKRHQQYEAFVASVVGDNTLALPAWTKVIQYQEYRIAFDGLCSSWLCRGDDDHRHLLVGQPQLSGRIQERGETDLIITIMHHPLSDLMEFDERNCEEYLRNNAHLLLRGHLHQSDVVSRQTGTGGYIEIAAGALHESFDSRNTFNIIDISENLSELVVTTYIWERGRWIIDRNQFADSHDGRGRFPLASRAQPDLSVMERRNRLSLGMISPDGFRPADESEEEQDGETDESTSDAKQEILDRFPQFTRTASGHDLAIRHDALENGLWLAETQRYVPVVSEWGANPQSYLAALITRLRAQYPDLLALHARCSNLTDGSHLQELLGQYAGVSPMQLAATIRGERRVLLVLDELATNAGNIADDEHSSYIETIRAYLDYCPNLTVVCSWSRQPSDPTDWGKQFVYIGPLDVADTRAYMNHNAANPVELESVIDYDRVQRATGGLPRHIDSILEALRYTDLDGALSSLDSASGTPTNELPKLIVDEITRLASASEDSLVRAYSMLTVLCILERGESLKVIKRVEAQSPLWPQHAHLLQGAGILDVVEQAPQISESRLAIKFAKSEKILHVPRVVRDYVISIMPRDVRIRVLKAAATVFFGTDWRVGGLRPKPRSSAFGLPSLLSTSNELGIVRSLMVEAASRDDASPCTPEEAIRLGLRYVSYLQSKGLYGECYEAAREVLGLTNDFEVYRGFPIENAELKLLAAKCARMVGDRTTSVRLLLEALPTARASGVKGRIQDVLLSLALAYEGLDQKHESIETAERVLETATNNTSDYLQAKAIIAGFDDDAAKCSRKLRDLQNRARRFGHHTVADNISIELASRASSVDEVLRQLAFVRTRREREYNYVRATVRRIEALLSEGRWQEITELDKEDMQVCYSLAFSQRMGGIFNWCHRVVWDYFECSSQRPRMLQLFTHSSFFWRLHGDAAHEREYAERLCNSSGVSEGHSAFRGEETSVLRYCRARLSALGSS